MGRRRWRLPSWFPAAAQAGAGSLPGCCTSQTTAQMKPHNSRAIAVTVAWAMMPRPLSRRKRPQSLFWAFHAIACTAGEVCSARRWITRVRRAGKRYAQAHSTSIRRTWALPAFVSPP